MVNGKAHGKAMSWHEDGSLKAQVLLDMGEVLNQKFWELGEKIKNKDEFPNKNDGDES